MSIRSASRLRKKRSTSSWAFSIYIWAVGSSSSVQLRSGSLRDSRGPWLLSQAHLANVQIFFASFEASAIILRQHFVCAAHMTRCYIFSASLRASHVRSDLSTTYLLHALCTSATALLTYLSHHSIMHPIIGFRFGIDLFAISWSCSIRLSTALSRASGLPRSIIILRCLILLFTIPRSIFF